MKKMPSVYRRTRARIGAKPNKAEVEFETEVEVRINILFCYMNTHIMAG